MKKLLITVFAALAGLPVLAQQNSSSTPAKSLSVAEANQLNGTAQPKMANGKSYAQWVAEEKAKNLAAAKSITQDFSNTVVTKTAVAEPQTTPAIKKVNNQGITDHQETLKVNPPAVTTQPEKTATTAESKVVIPAAAKGSSVDPDAKPVIPVKQTVTPASVPAQNSGNTVPATEKPVKKD